MEKLDAAPVRGLLSWLNPLLVSWVFGRAVVTEPNPPLVSPSHEKNITDIMCKINYIIHIFSKIFTPLASVKKGTHGKVLLLTSNLFAPK